MLPRTRSRTEFLAHMGEVIAIFFAFDGFGALPADNRSDGYVSQVHAADVKIPGGTTEKKCFH